MQMDALEHSGCLNVLLLNKETRIVSFSLSASAITEENS